MNDEPRPGRDDELPSNSAAAIVSYIRSEKDPRKLRLMLCDYWAKSRNLTDKDLLRFHEEVVASLLPSGYERERRALIQESSTPAPPERVDCMFLAVQPIELRAARHVMGLTGQPARVHKNRRFYKRIIECRAAGSAVEDPVELSAVLTAVGRPLNLHAMDALFEISEVYAPRVWILIGMAAGVRGEVNLGSVVLPDTVWWYEPGRLLPDMFEPRPEISERGQISRQLVYYDEEGDRLAKFLKDVIRRIPERHRPSELTPNYQLDISVLRRAIASGEKLLRDGDLLVALHTANQHIVASDQESYGFARACRETDWIIARGIADFGDSVKDSRWQFAATAIALATVLDFLENEYLPPDFEIF